MHYALSPLHLAFCTLPFALCHLHFAFCTLPFTLCPLNYYICTLLFALCTLHWSHAIYTLHSALCPSHYHLHFALWILHFALCTLHFALHPLHFTLCMSHFALCTLQWSYCALFTWEIVECSVKLSLFCWFNLHLQSHWLRVGNALKTVWGHSLTGSGIIGSNVSSTQFSSEEPSSTQLSSVHPKSTQFSQIQLSSAQFQLSFSSVSAQYSSVSAEWPIGQCSHVVWKILLCQKAWKVSKFPSLSLSIQYLDNFWKMTSYLYISIIVLERKRGKGPEFSDHVWFSKNYFLACVANFVSI